MKTSTNGPPARYNAYCFIKERMILIDVAPWVQWIFRAGGLIGGFGFIFGTFSVIWPARSIGLYQWIMHCFNWSVVPIDEAREIRNTRLLGILLAAISLFLFGNLFVF